MENMAYFPKVNDAGKGEGRLSAARPSPVRGTHRVRLYTLRVTSLNGIGTMSVKWFLTHSTRLLELRVPSMRTVYAMSRGIACALPSMRLPNPQNWDWRRSSGRACQPKAAEHSETRSAKVLRSPSKGRTRVFRG